MSVRRTLSAVALAATCALALAASAGAATQYPEAVVLVSGFDTQTPFTTPDPSCDGKEGEAWSPATGVAATLKAAGRKVFTAPVRQSESGGLEPCSPDGPAPPLADYVDSNGEVDANGEALAGFVAFLRDEYGVRRLQLVGHSDGGLWSRSAITQDSAYEGVAIRSLTTLGTPHTGSFVADLAIEVEGGKCDFEDKVLQGLCLVFRTSVEAIVDDIGQTATEELTNDYLATWNPLQRIGSCPVTGIAGTYVNVPLVPFTYYNPDDGLVGEASALGRSAYDVDLHLIPAPPIPDFRSGGTYPVVHGASISVLSKETLLNTQAISNKVAETIAEAPVSGPLCNVSAEASASAAAPPPSLRLPLTRLVVPGPGGRLPVPNREDAVVVARGAGLTCGAREVPLGPPLGGDRLRFAHLRDCHRPLRVRGGAGPRRDGALLIRRSQIRDAILRLRGDRIQLRVRGPRPRSVSVLLDGARGWRRLPIDASGRGSLPGAATHSSLRIRVTPTGGRRPWTATAVLRH